MSAAETVALFTGEEQTALMAFILTPQSDPQIDALRPRAMQLWMTLPFRSARLALDDTDFVQFVGALVTVDILTQLRAGAVLAGLPNGAFCCRCQNDMRLPLRRKVLSVLSGRKFEK